MWSIFDVFFVLTRMSERWGSWHPLEDSSLSPYIFFHPWWRFTRASSANIVNFRVHTDTRKQRLNNKSTIFACERERRWEKAANYTVYCARFSAVVNIVSSLVTRGSKFDKVLMISYLRYAQQVRCVSLSATHSAIRNSISIIFMHGACIIRLLHVTVKHLIKTELSIIFLHYHLISLFLISSSSFFIKTYFFFFLMFYLCEWSFNLDETSSTALLSF